MGTGNSIIEEAYKNYQILEETKNPAYGEFRFLKNRVNNSQIAYKKFLSDNSTEILKMHSIANKYERTRCQYIVRIVSFVKNSESLCSQFFKLSLYVDFFDQNLASLKAIEKSYMNTFIGNKEKHNDSFEILFSRDFTEQDYLHVIYCVSNALEFIHKEGRYHGAVNPWTILVSPDNYKLADHMLLNGICSFTELLSNPSARVYLSPEIFVCLKNGAIDKSISMQKADIFSLGLTILCLCKGIKPEIFYNFANYSFNIGLLDTHVQSLNYSFSKEFFQIMTSMLDIDPENRFSAQEIFEYLNKSFRRDDWGKMTFSRIEKNNNANEDIKESFQASFHNELRDQAKKAKSHHDSSLDSKLRLYYFPPEPSQQHKLIQRPIDSHSSIKPISEERNIQKPQTFTSPPQYYTSRKSNLNELKNEVDELDLKLNSLMKRSSKTASNKQFRYF